MVAVKIPQMTEAEGEATSKEITEGIEALVEGLPDNPTREDITAAVVGAVYGILLGSRAIAYCVEKLAAAVPEPDTGAPADARPVQVSVDPAGCGYPATLHVPGFGAVTVCGGCGVLQTGGFSDCKSCRRADS